MIQTQLKHFQLQKFRFTSKNILNLDENVRVLSVYKSPEFATHYEIVM